MKLKTLIDSLERARQKYILRYGKEPTIWNWSFDELELCGGKKRKDYGTVGMRPYMVMKVKNP